MKIEVKGGGGRVRDLGREKGGGNTAARREAGFPRCREGREIGQNYTAFHKFCIGKSTKRQGPAKKGGNLD